MDVMPGYKQTEVGVIPEDWEVVSIGTLITDFRGGAPLKPSDFTQTGIKVLPKGGVGRTGWLKIEEPDLQYCSPVYAASHRRNQVDESFTIVVLRDLVPSGPSIGLMVQSKRRETFVLAQGVYGFKVNKDAAVPGYLVHLSNTKWYRRLANSIMVGSTQVHITNTAFKRAQIPLPPVAEQEAIAETLSDADALIESLEQLIAKKRHIKQGTMQELLHPKDGWIPQELGEICTISKERFDPLSSATERKCVELEHLSSETGRLLGYFTTKDLRSQKAVFRRNDILFGKLRPYLRKFWRATFDGVCSTELWVIRAATGIDAGWLYWVVQTDQVVNAANKSTGTKMPRAEWSTVKKTEVCVPSAESEQIAIAGILSDMDAEIAALEAKLTKARQIKQGMMHNLLTGKIRLARPAPTVIPFPKAKESKVTFAKPHNWQINEAVVISVLVKRFGTKFLSRKRYTKLSYLLHRYAEGQPEGYRKKAAGPYNPDTKYKGPERIAQKKRIAQKNGYICFYKGDKSTGFIAGQAIGKAEYYFSKWYGSEVLDWLEQFHFKSNDELELLTTVDMAMEELRRAGQTVDVEAVKGIIQSHPEWEAKLQREIFSDANIARAIQICRKLFA